MLQNAVMKDGKLVGGYARIKSVEDNGKYSTAEILASKKNQNGDYETDFMSKYVRLIGHAHELAKQTQFPANVQITSLGLSNAYVKDGALNFNKGTSVVIMDFSVSGSNGGNSGNGGNSKPAQKAPRKEPDFNSVAEGLEDELPFN